MINLNEKGRIPDTRNEILTKSFLIDKIANEMKVKYKKVFSLINYDEFTLKSDIHNLLAKYISNKQKEINIKYIETTILNKVRQKYKILKTPLDPINKRKNKKLIKIVYSSPNKINTFLNPNKNIKTISAKKKKKLNPIIKNSSFRNNEELMENYKNKYYTNDEKIIDNENNLNNENINNSSELNKSDEKVEESNKLNEIGIHNDELKENIIKEKEEIKSLEKYREDIQNQIKNLENELSKRENIINLKKQITNIDINKEINNNDKINEVDNKKENIEIKNDYNWNYNPLMSFEQMQYLERRKRIEEDYYNKQNRYIFIKPRNNEKEDKENNDNENYNTNIYKYDNIKINKYSMDKLNEFNKIKEKIREEKEKEFRNRSAKNIHDFKVINEEIKPKNKNENNIPYEDKIQMKILQRSLNQEKAIEHLRNILYPQRQILEENEYQGFNNVKNLMKKNKYELADAARKIQIEKMKKLLDESIGDRQKLKDEEKEIEKRYRYMYEHDYDLFMEKERQKKIEKKEKIENYRKMLDDQIKAKNQKILDDNNILERNKDLWKID